MIEIGSIIEAEVDRIEVYGIYLKNKEDTIFVPLNRLTWSPERRVDINVGDRLKVLIQLFNDKTEIYSGSIKHLDTEGNPYHQLADLPNNTILGGTVTLIHHHGVRVKLEVGCSGDIPTIPDTVSLKVGDTVRVIQKLLRRSDCHRSNRPRSFKLRLSRSGHSVGNHQLPHFFNPVQARELRTRHVPPTQKDKHPPKYNQKPPPLTHRSSP